MMEIWTESAKFNAATQRFANQARLILSKDWLSEIVKICEIVNREEHTQRELSKQFETQIIETKLLLTLKIH